MFSTHKITRQTKIFCTQPLLQGTLHDKITTHLSSTLFCFVLHIHLHSPTQPSTHPTVPRISGRSAATVQRQVILDLPFLCFLLWGCCRRWGWSSPSYLRHRFPVLSPMPLVHVRFQHWANTHSLLLKLPFQHRVTSSQTMLNIPHDISKIIQFRQITSCTTDDNFGTQRTSSL